MRLLQYSTLTLITILLTACNGAVQPIDCSYKVIVTSKVKADTVAARYVNTKSYVFYNDTTKYIFENYEAAKAGKMIDISNKTPIVFNVEGVINPSDSVTVMQNLTQTPLTIVICDTINKIYAYKQAEVIAQLDTITVSLALEPYLITETKPVIQSNGWIIKK